MIISIINQKGGCGKTTTSVNLSAGLALEGQKVLLVDMDSQANATNNLNIGEEDVKTSIYDLLKSIKEKSFTHEKVKEAIMKTEFNIDIIPSDISLAESDQYLSDYIHRNEMLKKALSVVNDSYDYIILDCPPSLGYLTINSLAASDYYIITVNPSVFSIKGIKNLVDTIDLITEINSDLENMGVLITMYDQREGISGRIKEILEDTFEDKIFKSIVRQNVAIKYAQESAKPIMYYDKNCNAYNDYMSLTKEVLSYGK